MRLNNIRWMLKKVATLFRSLSPGNVRLLPPKHKEQGVWPSVLGGSPGPGEVQGHSPSPTPKGHSPYIMSVEGPLPGQRQSTQTQPAC